MSIWQEPSEKEMPIEGGKSLPAAVRVAAIKVSVWFQSMPIYGFLILSALLSALIVDYFFCPRFVLWKGLHLPLSWFNPEVNRAVDTLHQIQNPFDPIANPSNKVIQWRLFFPLLAHYLHLPNLVFLALPQLGCLLTLGWTTWLTLRETGDRLTALATAVLFGTASWFFVSMAWLTYFDSWYVLGLLLAAFHPSRFWLAAACLITPWIDERFVLALPMALGIRTVYFRREISFGDQPFMRDVLVCVLTVAPWVLFRIILIANGSDRSASTNFATQWQHLNPGLVLDGLWNGLRGIWVYAAIFFLYHLSRARPLASIYLAGSTVGALVMNLSVAGDISRSASNLIPLALMGFFELCRQQPFASQKLLYALAAFNLVVPASHVVSSFTIPIFYWPYEMTRYQNPPPEVNPVFYNQQGIIAWQNKKPNDALQFFSEAVELNPDFAPAYYNRGLVSQSQGDNFSAETDVRRAVEINPDLFDAQLTLATLLMGQGKTIEAKELLEDALKRAPATWDKRPEAERSLQSLR